MRVPSRGQEKVGLVLLVAFLGTLCFGLVCLADTRIDQTAFTMTVVPLGNTCPPTGAGFSTTVYAEGRTIAGVSTGGAKNYTLSIFDADFGPDDLLAQITGTTAPNSAGEWNLSINVDLWCGDQCYVDGSMGSSGERVAELYAKLEVQDCRLGWSFFCLSPVKAKTENVVARCLPERPGDDPMALGEDQCSVGILSVGAIGAILLAAVWALAR